MRMASAAAELARRQAIRSSMPEWAKACGFEPAPHHRYIIEKLERVARGELKRLLIAAPPGSAKSTFVSVLFPAWFLCQHPTAQVICASHTVELAERFSRRTRNLIAEHAAALGLALDGDSQAAGRWSLRSGGSLFAVGAGGAVVGHRADLVLIDDPLRGREQAFSESERSKLFEWFSADILPRCRPGAAICLVSTRWHLDDLFGRLEAEGGWEVISLPAVAEEDDVLGREPGQYLWDSDADYRYGDFLRAQREAQTPSTFSALFQQKPVADEGGFLKLEWLKGYRELPDRRTLHVYGASDYAVSEGRGDFSVHVVVGLCPQGRMYLLDMWRAQADSATSVAAFLDLLQKWKPVLGWAQESGQIRAALGPYMRAEMMRRNVYVAMETFPTRGDKQLRCQSLQGRAATSGLFVPMHMDWYPAFQNEWCRFPADAHDDIIDAMGLIGQLCDRITPERDPSPPKEPLVLSTDAASCTVTMDDLWREADLVHRRSGSSQRIW